MTVESIRQRLESLREEFDRGQQQLDRLDLQRRDVRDTLLRISGAIQVLEELDAQDEKREFEEAAFDLK